MLQHALQHWRASHVKGSDLDKDSMASPRPVKSTNSLESLLQRCGRHRGAQRLRARPYESMHEAPALAAADATAAPIAVAIASTPSAPSGAHDRKAPHREGSCEVHRNRGCSCCMLCFSQRWRQAQQSVILTTAARVHFQQVLLIRHMTKPAMPRS